MPKPQGGLAHLSSTGEFGTTIGNPEIRLSRGVTLWLGEGSGLLAFSELPTCFVGSPQPRCCGLSGRGGVGQPYSHWRPLSNVAQLCFACFVCIYM